MGAVNNPAMLDARALSVLEQWAPSVIRLSWSRERRRCCGVGTVRGAVGTPSMLEPWVPSIIRLCWLLASVDAANRLLFMGG